MASVHFLTYLSFLALFLYILFRFISFKSDCVVYPVLMFALIWSFFNFFFSLSKLSSFCEIIEWSTNNS